MPGMPQDRGILPARGKEDSLDNGPDLVGRGPQRRTRPSGIFLYRRGFMPFPALHSRTTAKRESPRRDTFNRVGTGEYAGFWHGAMAERRLGSDAFGVAVSSERPELLQPPYHER